MNRIVPPNLDQATISYDEGPKYDAAYLQELKASTRSARPPQPSDLDQYDADISMDMDGLAVRSANMDDGAFILYAVCITTNVKKILPP